MEGPTTKRLWLNQCSFQVAANISPKRTYYDRQRLGDTNLMASLKLYFELKQNKKIAPCTGNGLGTCSPHFLRDQSNYEKERYDKILGQRHKAEAWCGIASYDTKW